MTSLTESIDFIGIGAPRCGTSWIANVLRAHPDICISEPKEVRYFNRHEMQAGRLKGKQNSNFDQDLDWYLKRFSHAKPGQLRGEISPIYLSDPEAAAAIHARFPDIKLIVCLRNPVNKAYSLYKMHHGNGIIRDISFEQALDEETVYLQTSLYAQHLKRYLQHFDRNQLLLLIFEDVIEDPDRHIGRIMEFLGVDVPADLDTSKYHTNESAKRRFKWLHKFAFRVSQKLIEAGMSNVLEGLRSMGAHKVLNKVNAAPVQKEAMRDETRQHLAAAFRDDIAELEQLFELDLGHWQ